MFDGCSDVAGSHPRLPERLPWHLFRGRCSRYFGSDFFRREVSALVHVGHEPAVYDRVVLRVLALRAVVFHHSGAVPVVSAHHPDDDARVRRHYPYQYP